MKKIELLAPAGNMESLRLAIEAGADAIYLGGKNFGARAYSKNFSNEELVEAIKLAHLYNVKIYVTCNTLIYDSEVDEFINYIEFLHKNNVDAILLQDLGMLDYLRKIFPNLEIHSSTQMHIHNLEGAKLMKDLGVKRVVLSRETSIKEIKQIKENSNVDVEVFIHGALCISYSGQCLMSYFNGKRSGNKGECAGSCRLKYDVLENNKKINNDEDYPLSTKDLNSLERIGDLIDIGVDSLKIEGRMKSPAYVYLVTSLYRQAIDSYLKNGKVIIDKEKLHDLKVIFNREYTKGFLFNEKNNNIVNMKHPNHQGIEIGSIIACKNNNVRVKLSDNVYLGDALRILSKNVDAVILSNFYIDNKLVKSAKKGDVINFKVHQNVEIGSKVLKTSSEYIVDKINDYIKSNPRRVPITVTVSARINDNLKISITDGKNSVKVESIVLDEATNIPTTKKMLEEKINKINDYIYEISSLKINIDDNVFIPMKIFNDLRREALDILNNKRLYVIEYKKEKYTIDLPDFSKEKNTNVLVDCKKQYDKLNKDKYKYIYSNEIIKDTILRLPRVVNSYENYEGKYLVSEIGALYKLKNVDTDFSLNVVNSYTVAFLHSMSVNKITLSYELDYDQVRQLIQTYEKRYKKHPNLEVIVSSHPEVMISKFDLTKYYNKDNLLLNGNNTYIVKSRDNYMSLYLKELKIDNNNYFDIGINNIRENIEVEDE